MLQNVNIFRLRNVSGDSISHLSFWIEGSSNVHSAALKKMIFFFSSTASLPRRLGSDAGRPPRSGRRWCHSDAQSGGLGYLIDFLHVSLMKRCAEYAYFDIMDDISFHFLSCVLIVSSWTGARIAENCMHSEFRTLPGMNFSTTLFWTVLVRFCCFLIHFDELF